MNTHIHTYIPSNAFVGARAHSLLNISQTACKFAYIGKSHCPALPHPDPHRLPVPRSQIQQRVHERIASHRLLLLLTRRTRRPIILRGRVSTSPPLHHTNIIRGGGGSGGAFELEDVVENFRLESSDAPAHDSDVQLSVRFPLRQHPLHIAHHSLRGRQKAASRRAPKIHHQHTQHSAEFRHHHAETVNERLQITILILLILLIGVVTA